MRNIVANLRKRLTLVAALVSLSLAPGSSLAAAAASSSSAMQTDAAPGKLEASGPYYALVIGNDAYQSLPRLLTATNDAKAIAHVLHDEYGFSTSLLLNASRADILDALSTYRKKLPTNSNLLIYYAGHGTNDAEAKVAYWLPVDAQSTNNANWISADDITAELRVIKSLHILVVADSCYSGALMRGGDLIDLNSEVKQDERNFYLAKLQQVKSRNIMASGGNEPVADGGTDGHSIFAAVVLQSLRDKGAPEFTGSALFQRLVVRVAGRSQQTPQYSGIVNSQHDGGDFLFFHQPGKPAPPDLCCTLHTAVAGGNLANPSGTKGFAAPAGFEDLGDVLTEYRNAYENEDVAQLQRLWPTMAPDAARNLQNFFKTARSVSLHTSMVGSPDINPRGATISFTEQLSYMVDGKSKVVPTQKATMKLVKHTDPSGTSIWQIESIH